MDIYHQNKSRAVQILSALCVVLVLSTGAFAYLAWQEKQDADTASEKQADMQSQINTLRQQRNSKEATPTVSPVSSSSTTTSPSPAPVDPTADWSTYTSVDKNLTFKYPLNTTLATGVNPGKVTTLYSLYVESSKYASLPDAPFGYDAETATKDQAALTKNDPSVRVDQGVSNSYKMLTVPGALAKEFTVFGRLEVCDVEFQRTALIYKGDTRYRIVWNFSDPDQITKANTSYFTSTSECGSTLIWNDNQSGFYRDLASGKTDAISQEWFSSFDKIISSINLK